MKAARKRASPAAKPQRSPGRLDRLGKRVECEHAVEILAGDFEHAGRRGILQPDLGIAFVGEDQSTVPAGARDETGKRIARQDRALRVRGRTQIDRDRTGEQFVGKPGVVGHEAGRARCRQRDWLATCGLRAGEIRHVERIGQQDRRFAATRRNEAAGGERAEEQPLAAAVQHDHFALGVDRARQPIAAIDPGGDGGAERVGPARHRIAAEAREILGERRSDKARHRVARLTDGKIDRRFAGLGTCQQLGEADESGARGARVWPLNGAIGHTRTRTRTEPRMTLESAG
jgi:hypothetical protein